MSLVQFNIKRIRYGEKRFQSILHVRRNLRISSIVSYFSILPSVIFQVCLLSNKGSFFEDMWYFPERIPVRITCSSRHTILSYYLELKRENTSRDRKNIVRNMEVFEIWKFELWKVTYKSLLGNFTIPEK